MNPQPDDERIRQKAHELWEAEGHPHGRDQDHWDQAREIIAIQDSQGSTLLPRDTGAEEPIENAEESLRNLGDFPNLTDQGENLLTSTDRETVGGDMPSIEVPTSDQPGVPVPQAKDGDTATKPDVDPTPAEVAAAAPAPAPAKGGKSAGASKKVSSPAASSSSKADVRKKK